MKSPIVWCAWEHVPVDQCTDHAEGHPHSDVTGALGPSDEPQSSGALVVVWPGDYRRQEVWVCSGANIGNWYPLGGEFGQPKVWDPPRPDWSTFANREPEKRPRGTIPQHPHFDDILTRGPVSLLTHDNTTAYRTGWSNGRKRLAEQFTELAEEDE